MGCNCSKSKNSRALSGEAKPFSVMGNYKYLTAAQIAARLEVYKRMYCKTCDTRYDCTFEVYNVCTIRPQH